MTKAAHFCSRAARSVSTSSWVACRDEEQFQQTSQVSSSLDWWQTGQDHMAEKDGLKLDHLCQQLPHHVPVHIRQPELPSLVLERQPLVVQA